MLRSTLLEENASVITAATAARINDALDAWQRTKCSSSTKLTLLLTVRERLEANSHGMITTLAEAHANFFVITCLAGDVDGCFILMALGTKWHRR